VVKKSEEDHVTVSIQLPVEALVQGLIDKIEDAPWDFLEEAGMMEDMTDSLTEPEGGLLEALIERLRGNKIILATLEAVIQDNLTELPGVREALGGVIASQLSNLLGSLDLREVVMQQIDVLVEHSIRDLIQEEVAKRIRTFSTGDLLELLKGR